MEDKGVFTKVLAVTGTILTWLPILVPLFFAAAALVREGIFRFDYLMPAELFPIVLAGGALLFWAALRAHAHWKQIGLSFGIAITLLVFGQGSAIVTGLASGEMEPVGWWWTIVLASIIGYSIGVVALGIGGLLLLYDLFAIVYPRESFR
jgi:hypothetical protein